jgi:hypothetical protein
MAVPESSLRLDPTVAPGVTADRALDLVFVAAAVEMNAERLVVAGDVTHVEWPRLRMGDRSAFRRKLGPQRFGSSGFGR